MAIPVAKPANVYIAVPGRYLQTLPIRIKTAIEPSVSHQNAPPIRTMYAYTIALDASTSLPELSYD